MNVGGQFVLQELPDALSGHEGGGSSRSLQGGEGRGSSAPRRPAHTRPKGLTSLLGETGVKGPPLTKAQNFCAQPCVQTLCPTS